MKTLGLFKLFIFSLLMTVSVSFVHGQQAKVTVNQNAEIPELLMLQKSLEKERELSDGYTIQLYYGELDRANYIIKKYRSSYATWPASLEYETPNYKVWVGDFPERLDADRALLEIKQKFPSAFILKPNK